ncbi:hypothetical protein LEMLEM_LOCUS2169 [Lemmus lemmus]
MDGWEPLLLCTVPRFWSTSQRRCWSWRVTLPRISK